MPLYPFKCDECKHEVELFSRERGGRRRPKWKECGNKMSKVFCVPSLNIFKPMVYEHICETPILIRSRNHLKEECKKHNVTAARLM